MPQKTSLQARALEAEISRGLKITPQLEAARTFTRDLADQDSSVVGAFVHGSAARGDSLDDSDVDLHVVIAGEPPQPAALWKDDVVLDVMYVSTDLMTVDPRDLLDSEAGREELARGHLLWDIVDSIVVYDPDGLVRGYKRIAAMLSRDPEILKLRAGFILEDSVGTLQEARDGFAEDPLKGYTLLYRAPLPGVRAGAAPLAMEALVALASRPLGFRGLFPQFRVAAEDLGYVELVNYVAASWGVQDASVADADHAFDMLSSLFGSSVRAVEEASAEGDPSAAEAAPFVNALEHDRVLSLAKGLVDRGEVQGAIAFCLGKSMQLLSFEEFPNPWLNVDHGRPLEAVRIGVDKVLGSPTVEQTAERLDALDTVHWSIAELLSG